MVDDGGVLGHNHHHLGYNHLHHQGIEPFHDENGMVGDFVCHYKAECKVIWGQIVQKSTWQPTS